jgi:succinate-semialdehyde dehydrogenase/glutarate-semialdehyde dehydrogenase
VLPTSSGERVGDTLVASPLVRKLSFTGSTEVGKHLLRGCAATLKKVSLELGGNAPFIVFEDADIDAAVDGAMASKFRNSGQTCVCANRFLVHEAVYEAFAERLAARVTRLKVGNGFDDGVEQGPLIDAAALGKVERHVADAVGGGAQVLCGGSRHELGGTWFQPTVLTGVQPGMAVCREETFGPLAPLLRFSSEDEAVELANATTAGLAAYFYSRDIGRIWRVAERLECGMVGINSGVISSEVVPFGGVKQSGIGREGSRYGLDDYLEFKYLSFGGLA